MIKLTKEEKAARYDALQAAIKHTIECYKRHIAYNYKRYEELTSEGVLGAYNYGVADGFKSALEDLERWADS